jgi:hypothetical protein
LLNRLAELCKGDNIQHLREYEYGVVLSRSCLAKLKAIRHTSSTDASGQDTSSHVSLIASLISSLAKFDSNGLEFNLYLSDALAKLALFPDEGMHSYLLDPASSLIPTLVRLSKQYSYLQTDVVQLLLVKLVEDEEQIFSRERREEINGALFVEVLREIVANLFATQSILSEEQQRSV